MGLNWVKVGFDSLNTNRVHWLRICLPIALNLILENLTFLRILFLAVNIVLAEVVNYAY